VVNLHRLNHARRGRPARSTRRSSGARLAAVLIRIVILPLVLSACSGGSGQSGPTGPAIPTGPAAVVSQAPAPRPAGFVAFANSYVRFDHPPSFAAQPPATSESEVVTHLVGPPDVAGLSPQILLSTRDVRSDNAVDADLDWQVYQVRQATLTSRRTVAVNGALGSSVELDVTYPQALPGGSSVRVRLVDLFMQAPRGRGVTLTLVAPLADFGRLGLSAVLPTVSVLP